MKEKSNEPTKIKKAMKKTMRFLSMVALALVGAVMTGCSSDDNSISEPQQPETKSNVVTLTTTVSLDGDAAGTRALTGEGVKTFAVGETMALVYKNTSNETVKVESVALAEGNITEDGKSATFTFTLVNPSTSENVTYIYPAAMAKDDGSVKYDALASQNGILATLSSTLDLATCTAAWNGTSLPAVTLANQLAILALTLKNADGTNDITNTITGLTLSAGTNSYAITREAATGPIYVAIQPTSSATITVAATTGTTVYTKSLTDKTYAASNGYSASWKMTEQTGATGGFFSVSDTKKVYFSKGNLRYASGTWSFFDNQYDYYTSYSADAWDKFGWSTSAPDYGMNTSTSSSDYSGDFKDWGDAVGSGWRTLSSAEWTYLFDTRTVNSGSGKSYTLGKSVNGKLGVVIYPDDYTGSEYEGSNWSTFEAAGCVFLPEAGYRDGTSVYDAGSYGGYWSSSPGGANSAYFVNFGSFGLNPPYNDARYYGYSVRLVRQVE